LDFKCILATEFSDVHVSEVQYIDFAIYAIFEFDIFNKAYFLCLVPAY